MEDIEDRLYTAVCNEDLQTLEWYLSNGLGVNHVFTCCNHATIHGQTLVQLANCKGIVSVVSFLINKGCDVNISYRTFAGADGQTKVKLETKKDCLSMTCLYKALCSENMTLIKVLVNAGADVNLYDQSRCSAIWHAVDTNSPQIVDIMLTAKEANTNIQDSLQISPLHVAVLHKNCHIIKSLISHEAKIDICQIQGATPLSLACVTGYVETVKMLLQHGADPNHKDNDGLTPLACALDQGHSVAVCYLLIYAGAYSHTRNIDYKSIHLLRQAVQLREYLETLKRPPDLKVIVALHIKNMLRKKQTGRSIYDSLATLPLPRPLIDYLQLNRV